MRLFIALPLSAEIQNTLADWKRVLQKSFSPHDVNDVKDVKWVEDHNTHLTLEFLGDISPATSHSIHTALEPVSQTPSFEMEIRGIGCFPHTQMWRVLWAGVGKGATNVCALYDAITHLMPPDVALQREATESFVPHITLARRALALHHTCRDGKHRSVFDDPLWQSRVCGTMYVDRVCLIESQLSNTGPCYTVRQMWKLKDNAKC